MPKNVKDKVGLLPHKPGVYQFLDINGKVIYVGKAKNLRKRVASYFTNTASQSGRIKVLVSRIQDIEIIIVETENEALLLENNLIKKYQPRYNVMLKDDKTYPWICIRNEPFPRVYSTRTILSDGTKYFGPYTSGALLKTIIEFIRQLFPIRTCSLPLSVESIKAGKFKSCLEYDIGNCKAPCEGLQTPQDYNDNIQSIEQILKGNIRDVTLHISKQMKEAAQQLRYEEAHQHKQRLGILEKYQSKTTIVSPKLTNIDVYSIVNHNSFACVNYLQVVNGAILQSHNIELRKTIEESQEDLLAVAITELRERFAGTAKEIIVPFIPDFKVEGCKYSVPARGEKQKLLELSLRNSKAFAHTRVLTIEGRDFRKREERILKAIQEDFHTKELPRHIECFDNSNLQGTNPVAACVVFRNTKPAKREYRHFNIKTVEGADDFASMYEVVYRRYKRMTEHNDSLPHLIVIDGGKGQLSNAYRALKDVGIEAKVQIVGIAKRLEEIFFPSDSVPLYLDKNSESLKIVQHLRNEAHRFGISHHRNKRSKGAISSEYNSIPGIGDKTVEILFREFKTKENIINADIKSLGKIVGKSKANIIYNYIKQQAANKG